MCPTTSALSLALVSWPPPPPPGGGGQFREPERERAAHPEGWEGDADFAAEGTVGAMAELGRGGRLDLASLGEEDDCDEPWCFVWI
jgi:hypothetical protein